MTASVFLLLLPPVLALAVRAQSADPAIIYQNDFDRSPLGAYTEARARSEFPNVDTVRIPGNAAHVVAGPEAYLGRSMRIEVFDNGTTSAHLNIFFRLPGGGKDDVYTSFMYTTSPNFKSETGGKLCALAGSKYGTQGTEANPQTGRRYQCVADGEFNSKPHLSGSGKGTHNYTFSYGTQNCKGGSGFWWDGKNGSTPNVGPTINSAHGTWRHIEFRIKVNTPGKADGILQTWHDGELVLNNTTMEWRKTGAHNVERAKFQAFVSGAKEIDVPGHYVYYDNYIISTTRQGPPGRRAGH
jgi:hypothetical protein